MMLEDLIGCTHALEIPISEDGEILYWQCRCGQVQKTQAEVERENAEAAKDKGQGSP